MRTRTDEAQAREAASVLCAWSFCFERLVKSAQRIRFSAVLNSRKSWLAAPFASVVAIVHRTGIIPPVRAHRSDVEVAEDLWAITITHDTGGRGSALRRRPEGQRSRRTLAFFGGDAEIREVIVDALVLTVPRFAVLGRLAPKSCSELSSIYLFSEDVEHRFDLTVRRKCRSGSR